MSVDLSYSHSGAAQVQRVAIRWTEIAANQLQGLGLLIDQGLTTDAPGPLYRSVLEHAARAAWVVDGPSSEARIARALLSRLVATADDVRTAEEAGDGPAVMFNARERFTQLVETTIPDLLGAGPDLGKPGTQSVHYRLAGESYGTVRDVVDGFVHRYFPSHNGTVLYRLASVFAHPNTSGAFVFVTEEADGSATTVTPVEHVASRTVAALRAWQVANRRVCAYLGWRAEQEAEWSALVDTLDRATSHRRDAVRATGVGGRRG